MLKKFMIVIIFGLLTCDIVASDVSKFQNILTRSEILEVIVRNTSAIQTGIQSLGKDMQDMRKELQSDTDLVDLSEQSDAILQQLGALNIGLKDIKTECENLHTVLENRIHVGTLFCNKYSKFALLFCDENESPEGYTAPSKSFSSEGYLSYADGIKLQRIREKK